MPEGKKGKCDKKNGNKNPKLKYYTLPPEEAGDLVALGARVEGREVPEDLIGAVDVT